MGIATLFQVRDSFRMVLPQWEWLSRACAAFRAVWEVQGPVLEDMVVYVTWRRLGPSSMLREFLYLPANASCTRVAHLSYGAMETGPVASLRVCAS